MHRGKNVGAGWKETQSFECSYPLPPSMLEVTKESPETAAIGLSVCRRLVYHQDLRTAGSSQKCSQGNLMKAAVAKS